MNRPTDPLRQMQVLRERLREAMAVERHRRAVVAQAWQPPMDLRVTEAEYEIALDLPGASRDAIELTALPAIEVHISDIYKREPFRRISVIHDVCISQVVGLGLDSYRVATEQLCRHLGGTEHV